MGKKIIDFEMRRDASRGRKSKAGGEKIKSDSIIYTPESIGHFSPNFYLQSLDPDASLPGLVRKPQSKRTADVFATGLEIEDFKDN